MAAPRPVGVHVRDDVESRFFAQPAGDRVGIVEQFLERAFHPPGGHRLAGMLAAIKPDLQRAVAEPEIIHLLPVEALAERAVAYVGVAGDGGDEIVVPLHRIGSEIGEPGAVRRRRHGDGQDTVRIGGIDPFPFLAVHRHARPVIFPAQWVGGSTAIEDAQLHRFAGPAGQPEVEPLVEIGILVLDDLKVDAAALEGDQANVAAIEGARYR